MRPQGEPCVDLEEVEAPVRPVLEVQLGDAPQVQRPADLPAEPDDIRVVTLSGSTISKGSHTLTVVIDPGNAIAESNEANNRITTTFTL